jgi:hypothetical protein
MRSAVLAGLVACLAGCGDDDATPTIAATADVTMLRAGEEMILTVTVSGFSLVDPGPAPPNASGQGHFHVYLDTASGASYLLATHETMPHILVPEGTSAGAHTLRLELVENDHSPIEGATPATIAFTVLAPAPTLSATVSPDPATAGDTITIDVTVTSFTLDHAAAGSPAVPGEGHYHIHIDDPDPSAYQQFSGMDPSTWMVVAAGPPSAGELAIPTGNHMIILFLVENDHSPVEPAVRFDIPITIQ